MGDRDGTVEISENAAWLAAAVVLVVSLGGAVVLAEWPLSGVPPDEPEKPHLVEPTDGGTKLWPYTARAHEFKSRTLGINMVFYGDPERVQTALTDRSKLEWEKEPIEEDDANAEAVSRDRLELDPEAEELSDAISWVDAEGSNRYTYFETDDGGRWVGESYQLHTGTYFGQRRHIRAYDDPAAEWTAVQIHEEHWDWFRLRHTVTGISDSQRELEREFMNDPAAETVVRMPFENETADSDGWVSGIHLAGAVVPMLFFGLAGRSRKLFGELSRFIDRRHREVLLGGGLFGLYTVVRWLGIGAEMAFSGVSPKVIAAPLYLLLVAGIPTIAYVFGKETDPTWAFTSAVLGLGTAIVVDFAAMGVSVLPLRVILHRGAVLLAVGLIAVGSGPGVERSGRPAPLVVGIGGWILVLFASLFGYV
jgi:hypothetical protein